MMLLLNAVRCMTRWRLVTDGRAGGDASEAGGDGTFRNVSTCVCVTASYLRL